MLEKLSQQQIEKFDAFAAILQRENAKLNLTRILDAEQIRVRHFEDSLVIVDALKAIEKNCKNTPKLIDVGSGGGFPGLAIAIALPCWQVVSVEATGKKTEFQKMIVNELGLDNAEVLHERAEILGHNKKYREQFDVATTRAVGSVAMIAELTGAFLKIGGEFFAWKGPKVESELTKGQQRLAEMGFCKLQQEKYTLTGENAETDYRIIRAEKIKKTAEKYPREFKIIKQQS